MAHLSHGTKLNNRINDKKHIKEKPLLLEIRNEYNKLIEVVTSLDPFNLDFVYHLVDAFNEYYVFWDNPKYKKLRSNGRSKLYPSVNEELMEQLFKAKADQCGYVCGYGPIPIGLRCTPPEQMTDKLYFDKCLNILYLDADFYIGIPKKLDEKRDIIIPVVIIENKRYPDSNMQATVGANVRAVKNFAEFCHIALVVDKASGHGEPKEDLQKLGLNQMHVLKDDCERLKDERLPYHSVVILYDDIIDVITGKKKSKLTFKQKCNRSWIYD